MNFRHCGCGWGAMSYVAFGPGPQRPIQSKFRFTETVSSGQSELGTLESDLGKLTNEAGQAGRDLDRDTAAAAARLETTAERLRRIAQVAHERSRAVSSRIEGAGERRRDLHEENARLTADLELAIANEQQAVQEAELKETTLRAVEDEARSVAEQEAMPAEGALAMARGDLRSMEGAGLRDDRESDDISRRLDLVEARQSEDAEEIERLNEQIRSTDELTAVAQSVYENKKVARGKVQDGWEQTERLVRTCEVARVAASRQARSPRGGSGWTVESGCPQGSSKRRICDWCPSRRFLTFPMTWPVPLTQRFSAWADALVVNNPIGLSAVASALKAALSGDANPRGARASR